MIFSKGGSTGFLEMEDNITEENGGLNRLKMVFFLALNCLASVSY